jgi:hypothetical protein
VRAVLIECANPDWRIFWRISCANFVAQFENFVLRQNFGVFFWRVKKRSFGLKLSRVTLEKSFINTVSNGMRTYAFIKKEKEAATVTKLSNMYI